MKELIQKHQEQLELIAEAWLSNGATSFSVWFNGELLEKWRNGAAESAEVISAPIGLNGSSQAKISVSGVNTESALKRLKADANLLASLLPLQRDRQNLAEELVDARDQLVSLYSLTEATRKKIEIKELLDVLASEASKLMKVQEVFFLLEMEDRPPNWVFSPKQSVDKSYLIELCQHLQPTGRPFLFSGNQQANGAGKFSNLLIVPFKVFNAKQAILGFMNKQSGEFNSADIKLAKGIADFAGAQIENLNMIRSNIEMVRLETEIELAQNIQQSLLPRQVPHVRNLDIHVVSRPASRIGGDFYDFIPQSDRYMNFIIGDISGKGLPAALLMAMTLKVIRSETSMPLSPGPDIILNRSNSHLYIDFSDAVMFSTIFVGQYTLETGELRFSNAGHSPVIYCPFEQKAKMLKADSVPLGLFPDLDSESETLRIRPGDVLVLATDGLNETSNSSNRLFGFTQLEQLVEKLASHSAKEISEGIFSAVEAYGEGKSQEDDRTLIVIKGI